MVGDIVFLDGSVKFDAENEPSNGRGYGCMLIDEASKQTKAKFYEHVETSDPQQAELNGIHAAIELANELCNSQNCEKTTILCDCKNANNNVTGEYRVPWKYTEVYQAIREGFELNNGYHINIKWIPGHTENKIKTQTN